MSQTILLALQGLSCEHCVGRVKKALEARPDVEQAEVSLHSAKVTGAADSQALIATVEAAGYEAAPAAAVTLQLSGLSCQHCVATTRKALEAVPGVTAAEVSLDSAKVYGDAQPDALVAAVTQAGYEAVLAGEPTRPKPSR